MKNILVLGASGQIGSELAYTKSVFVPTPRDSWVRLAYQDVPNKKHPLQS